MRRQEHAVIYVDLDADALVGNVNAQCNGDLLEGQRLVVNLAVRGSDGKRRIERIELP